MNVAYVLYDKEMSKEANMMLDTLRKVSDCEVVVDIPGVNFPMKEFTGRIATCKIERLDYWAVQYWAKSANILALDADMLIRSDPFEMFKMEGDVFVTTRKIPWKHPVNGGVWGFRCNDIGLD